MVIAAKLFWFAYPYPNNPSQDEINLVWSVHIIAEKLFGYLVIVFTSVYITYKYRLTHGFQSVYLAIVCAISYNVIAAIIWIAQFGYEPYFEHSLPLKLLFIVIVLSAVVSLISYQWLPNKALKREN
ncbi:hypothetical protein [Colwellia sp. Arc7-D]|uniref:hypothetical protein n=1 Tax=Colwellia sp. Arc7-D TaxID=2161872 RepID=UPI0013A5AA06|nr:hypothetical protein [Colwellia sp. Arc7-D]